MGFRTWTYDPNILGAPAPTPAPAPAPAPAPITPEVQQQIQQYQSGQLDPNAGIPNTVLQAAQADPSLGIDTSGWNLPTTDPMYNFYNQPVGSTPGVNWFPTDDRNNPMLQPGFDPSTTAYNPTPVASDYQFQPQILDPAQQIDAEKNGTAPAPLPVTPDQPPADSGTQDSGIQLKYGEGEVPPGPTGLGLQQNLTGWGGGVLPILQVGSEGSTWSPNPSGNDGWSPSGTNVTTGKVAPGTVDPRGGAYQGTSYGFTPGENPGDVPLLDRINLPGVPQLGTGLPGTSEADSVNFMNAIARQIQQQYQYQTPLAQAAQMNLGLVPQNQIQQMATSAELQRMLSGEGYSPQMIAKMRASAMEDPAMAGIQEMAAARRALSMAGLNDSPAAAGVTADVARRTGQAQIAANRDVDVNNANAGLQNFRQGVGFQTQIGMSNMEQANQMALANANRLFSAMSQNTANQQQANMSNAGAQQDQMSRQAGAVSGFLGNQGSMINSNRLGWAQQAAATNNQNTINQQNNQAQLDWQHNLAGFNEQNDRYKQAMGVMSGGGFNPLAG